MLAMITTVSATEVSRTWKEIIPNQHAEQDKIVDDTLHIEWEWQCIILELQLQVLSQQADLQ